MAKLVTIGDSLTQGFSSLSIHRVDQSYPALLARALNLAPHQFVQAEFRGRGGLPLNLEWLLRRIEGPLRSHPSPLGWALAAYAGLRAIDEVERYWERGPGSQPSADELFHNLSVWGSELADAKGLTAGRCEAELVDTKPNWLGLPSASRLRTARAVWNPAHLPARSAETQLSLARRIRERDGEIEHLVVWLGGNNCLGTVISLRAEPEALEPPGPLSGYLLWHPSAFEREYEELARCIVELGARKVFVATVPHVVIPPLTHGVMAGGGELPPGEKYFDYYVYPIVTDDRMDPQRDRYLSKADAKKIDHYIDCYNEVIRFHAGRNGWCLVDLCDVLDRLAVRRNHGSPTYPLPSALAGLDVRFFRTDAAGNRTQGGLFGLDGVHPTACGYGLIAQEFVDAIRATGTPIADVDLERVRREDTLVSLPPRALYQVTRLLEWLERHFHVTRHLDSRRLRALVAGHAPESCSASVTSADR